MPTAGLPTCFVIMPFEPPIGTYYDSVFKPAIESAGLNSIRADSILTPGVVMRQIWVGIREAAVCLAELTTLNANVMYELGLAHALGKPVVQVTQSIPSLPFDMRHIRHVVYHTSDPNWAPLLQKR
jgi:nucleoside 2-deoxyribosyltransferase